MMGLNYSQEAKKAKANFYNQFNDIDIFVEDTAYRIQKLYLIIFEKIFGKIKINEIFPLGGKSQVIMEYNNNNKNNIKEKPSLFIIDGDLDLFSAMPTYVNDIKSKSHLCCLNRYSIENYLIEKKAIFKIIEKYSKKEIKNIEKKIDYDNWIIKNLSLLKLFIYYSIIHEKKLGIQNVSYGVLELCHETDNEGVIDEAKIKKRIENIKNKIKLKNNDNLKKIYKDRFELLSEKNNLIIYVAGKNLIQLIFKRSRNIIAKIGNGKNAKEIFMQKLATECEFKDLKSLLEPFITVYCIKNKK